MVIHAGKVLIVRRHCPLDELYSFAGREDKESGREHYGFTARETSTHSPGSLQISRNTCPHLATAHMGASDVGEVFLQLRVIRAHRCQLRFCFAAQFAFSSGLTEIVGQVSLVRRCRSGLFGQPSKSSNGLHEGVVRLSRCSKLRSATVVCSTAWREFALIAASSASSSALNLPARLA